MNRVKFILLPDIIELEWKVNQAEFKIIKRLWKQLPDNKLSNINANDEKVVFYITNCQRDEILIFFSTFIVRKSKNIIVIKNNQNKIENYILKTIPEWMKYELSAYLKYQKAKHKNQKYK